MLVGHLKNVAGKID